MSDTAAEWCGYMARCGFALVCWFVRIRGLFMQQRVLRIHARRSKGHVRHVVESTHTWAVLHTRTD